MVPDSDEINLSTVELQVLTELDRLVSGLERFIIIIVSELFFD